MGYRSDVRINTNKAGWERFKEIIGTKIDDYFDFGKNGPEFFDSDEDSVIFGWNEVKWYYDAPRAVEEAVGKLVDEGYPAQFIRVGEDDDDVSYFGNNEDALERRIGTETNIVIW